MRLGQSNTCGLGHSDTLGWDTQIPVGWNTQTPVGRDTDVHEVWTLRYLCAGTYIHVAGTLRHLWV